MTASRVAILFALALAACRDPYQDVEQEKAWAAEVRKKYTERIECAQTQDGAYLRKLVADITAVADANPYKFEVCLDNSSSEINAYAFPAGFIVVNAGMMRAVSEESSLAGVLGHEISHVVLRHSFQAEKKRQWGSRFFGSMKNPVLRVPAQLFGAAGMLKYSREHEKYADLMGIEIAQRAGFDPRGILTFFEMLETLEFRRFPLLGQMLSTHPASGERLKYIRRQINRMESGSYRQNSKEFVEMKTRYRQSL